MFNKVHISASTVDSSSQEVIDRNDTKRSRSARSIGPDNRSYRGPQKIPKWSSNRILSILLDLLLLGVALVFAAYGISVKQYEGRAPGDRWSQTLYQASQVGPTIFPILFAAIAARALKAIAQWRLEKGSQLGPVDQLVGSTSVLSTITTQLKLRALNFLSLALIGLWALSPVGGQASIRILELHQAFSNAGLSNATTSIQFLNISSNAINERYAGADTAGVFTQSNALFAASLSSPRATRNSSADIWGNVRIPMLESLDASAADTEGWISVDGSRVDYASLIGLPISQALSMANTYFSIETNYWHLDCPTFSAIPNPSQCNISGWDLLEGGMYLSSPRSHLNDPWQASTTDCRPLAYCGWDTGGATGANCTVSNSYVEVKVYCANTSCSVTQMRRSTVPNPPVCWTQLDVASPDFEWYANGLVNSLGMFHEASTTTFQGYLTRPDDPFNLTKLPPVSTLSNDVFALRLSQLLNTYWYALLGASSVQLGISNSNLNETARQSSATVGVTDGYVELSGNVIGCNNSWLAVLLVSVFILVLVGVAGIYATSRSMGPEISFIVSAIVKDSPHVTVPRSSSALSTTDRARLMKDINVRYGDVDADGEVGSIAVATTRGIANPGALRRDRFYA